MLFQDPGKIGTWVLDAWESRLQDGPESPERAKHTRPGQRPLGGDRVMTTGDANHESLDREKADWTPRRKDAPQSGRISVTESAKGAFFKVREIPRSNVASFPSRSKAKAAR